MERIKLLIILALFGYIGAQSFGYVNEYATRYRNMMAPPPGADIGPPVEGKFVELSGPLAPPTGEPRDDDVWDFDVTGFVLNERRVTMSDIKTGYYFLPERCLKCHEEEGPGQNFYGNEEFMEVQEFITSDGLYLVSFPEKKIFPTIHYIYKDRHLKKVPFDVGAPYDMYMKRGQ